jgi:molybdopterin synthase sulfur carrier subunit
MMAPQKPLRLLYFAWLRERLSRAEEVVPVPPGVTDVAGLRAWLRGRGDGFAAAFAPDMPVRCAVNQDFAGPATPVSPGDEIAFFPPVTGG